MKDRWWMRTPRHPGLVLAMAMLTALVVSAGITMVLTAGGGAHRPLAAGAGLGAAVPAPSSSADPASTSPASTSPSPSPARTAPARTAPSAPAGKSGSASPPGKRTPPASPPASPTTSASPSASSSPAQGYLLVAPDQLMLTSKAGQPASGFFVLTAANGPVAQYTVRVTAKAGKVSVAPSSGSLATDGFVEVTVTVISKVALTTQIVAEPGDLSVTVVYQPKPKPKPAPTPGGGGGGG